MDIIINIIHAKIIKNIRPSFISTTNLRNKTFFIISKVLRHRNAFHIFTVVIFLVTTTFNDRPLTDNNISLFFCVSVKIIKTGYFHIRAFCSVNIETCNYREKQIIKKRAVKRGGKICDRDPTKNPYV